MGFRLINGKLYFDNTDVSMSVLADVKPTYDHGMLYLDVTIRLDEYTTKSFSRDRKVILHPDGSWEAEKIELLVD